MKLPKVYLVQKFGLSLKLRLDLTYQLPTDTWAWLLPYFKKFCLLMSLSLGEI